MLFILAVLPLKSFAECNVDLDENQVNVLKRAYQLGSAHDLGLSLAAIAWQESQAGKYLINWSDPSFGVFHSHLRTASSRTDTRGYLNKVELSQRLMVDMEFASALAIEELLYWKGRMAKKGLFGWRNIWAAYNGGNNFDGSAAQAYADSIAKKVAYLKKCILTDNERAMLKAGRPVMVENVLLSAISS